MKKTILLFVMCVGVSLIFAQRSQSQWPPESTEWYAPVPPKVIPGKAGQPPSDAIILFDGKDLSKWESAKAPTEAGKPRDPAPWKIVNGELVIVPRSGDIQTKEYFGDCQLHVEYKSSPSSSSEYHGNSGIFLQSTYEVQIYDGELYVNGMVGSLYKQSAPLANAYTNPGEWQVFDIYWKAPVFNGEDQLLSPAIITVVLNGVLIQNNYIMKGHTPYTGLPRYTPHGRLPLSLQDHGDEIKFRNIWIRNL